MLEKWARRPRPCFPTAIDAAARDAYLRGDFAAALGMYLQAADGGDTAAQVFAGWMITEGLGMPKHQQSEGKQWYLKAAESEFHEAYFWLGDYHERIDDYETSKENYIKAAKLGNIPAHFRLGILSTRARADPRIMTVQESVHWLSLAGSKGHAHADARLAYLARSGIAPGGWLLAIRLALRSFLRIVYYTFTAPQQERPRFGESHPCLRL